MIFILASVEAFFRLMRTFWALKRTGFVLWYNDLLYSMSKDQGNIDFSGHNPFKMHSALGKEETMSSLTFLGLIDKIWLFISMMKRAQIIVL